MNFAKLEAENLQDISFDFKKMKKILDKEWKKLEGADEYAAFICDIRARVWYWQEEDHPDEEIARFYNKTWQSYLNKAGTKLTQAEYMDLYYAVDPNP